ncbi:SdrD B-like domain-containing protein [Lentzea sp. NPDC051213]|uniref:SdrD B-like domain-containing protein n=1 Tax=Lentzea sp. NPDC051213 TaxID=3364126 RepID=UPI0037BC910A
MTTAALLALGGTSAAALAQDDPTSTSPVPTETSTPPPSASEAAPPPSNEPASAPPAKQTGVSGVLYADKNRNGQQDPGEAIEGGKVEIFGGSDSSKHETTSAADGKFSFRGLAPGTYHPSYQLADGWVVHRENYLGDPVTVTANETAELTARAERPYSEQLKATAALDRDDYRYPATAKITLTLTNTTDREIKNIQAACDRDVSAEALGRGAGWTTLTSTGVTLAAGQQHTITIDEALPQAAQQQGLVRLGCDFAPQADWNKDGPAAGDQATVSGGTGGYTMVLGEDRNGDLRIDADEAAKNTKVLLLRPQTGEQAAEGTSDGTGKIEFTGLPAGDYRAVLIGSWAFTDPAGATVRITAEGGFSYRFLKHASPANLRVSAKFAKPSYQSHETVHFDLTVTNIGGQTAERVRVPSFWEVRIPNEQFGDFGWNGPGVQIPAGESRTFSFSGKIRSFGNGRLSVHCEIDYLGEPNPTTSYADATADIVQTTGAVEGVVYADKNRNGQQDPGEAAPGTKVELNGGSPDQYLSATTDADGRFSFAGIPTGDYYVSYTLADGWLVRIERGNPQVRVEPEATLQLTARAVRPDSEVLTASVTLDKTDYAVGEEARMTLTVKNRGDRAVEGLQIGCNGNNDPNVLGGGADEVPGWEELSHRGAGMTLAPGETRSVVGVEKVPAAAARYRKVEVFCDLARNIGYNFDGPRVYDWATVPGGTGTVAGPLYYDRNKNFKVDAGEAIANTRIVLRTHRENGANVTETVSDANGNARFEGVPPGSWWAWVDGPWKFEGEYGGRLEVQAGFLSEVGFPVVPGPPPSPDPDPGTGAGEPEGGGGATKALARTGASVLGLGLVAALLVAFGIGARVAGRRRTN